MIKVILAVLCLATLAYSQVPVPCRSPYAFEGKHFEIDPSKKFEMWSHFAYDAMNERTRSMDIILINKTRDFYEILRLHRYSLEYRVDLKTKKCTIHPLTEPFRHIEIPRDAHLIGEIYIGGSYPGEGVEVSMWNGTTPDKQGRWFGSFTTLGCIPVSVSFDVPRTGFVHSNFYDVTLGISDPSIFNPPPECKQGKFKYVQDGNFFIQTP